MPYVVFCVARGGRGAGGRRFARIYSSTDRYALCALVLPPRLEFDRWANAIVYVLDVFVMLFVFSELIPCLAVVRRGAVAAAAAAAATDSIDSICASSSARAHLACIVCILSFLLFVLLFLL